jgi:hypothetical protein
MDAVRDKEWWSRYKSSYKWGIVVGKEGDAGDKAKRQ